MEKFIQIVNEITKAPVWSFSFSTYVDSLSITFGRNHDCTIVIDDRRCSRHQATLTLRIPSKNTLKAEITTIGRNPVLIWRDVENSPSDEREDEYHKEEILLNHGETCELQFGDTFALVAPNNYIYTLKLVSKFKKDPISKPDIDQTLLPTNLAYPPQCFILPSNTGTNGNTQPLFIPMTLFPNQSFLNPDSQPPQPNINLQSDISPSIKQESSPVSKAANTIGNPESTSPSITKSELVPSPIIGKRKEPPSPPQSPSPFSQFLDTTFHANSHTSNNNNNHKVSKKCEDLDTTIELPPIKKLNSFEQR